MKQKKGTAETVPQKKELVGSLVTVGNEPENSGEIKSAYIPPFRVDYFAEGVALNAPHIGNPTGKGGGSLRGEVKGWSRASRRRMREFMISHSVRPDYDQFSVTLTIPGPALPVPMIKRLWKNFQMRLNRLQAACLWRLEVQQRGAAHWHCIIGLPQDRRVPWSSLQNTVEQKQTLLSILAWSQTVDFYGSKSVYKKNLSFYWETGVFASAALIRQCWLDSLDSLGSVEWWVVDQHIGPNPPPVRSGCSRVSMGKDDEGVSFCADMTLEKPSDFFGVSRFWNSTIFSALKEPESKKLSEWYGAKQRAACVEICPDEFGAWKRYLQDHTSKSKQEQIAEGFGRHWGTIGKDHFRRVLPESCEHLTHQQFARFLRAYQRLCTPYIRDPSALFGRRRGFLVRRGRSGRSVFFSNPETVRRLVEYAVKESPQLAQSWPTTI